MFSTAKLSHGLVINSDDIEVDLDHFLLRSLPRLLQSRPQNGDRRLPEPGGHFRTEPDVVARVRVAFFNLHSFVGLRRLHPQRREVVRETDLLDHDLRLWFGRSSRVHQHQVDDVQYSRFCCLQLSFGRQCLVSFCF